MTDRKKPDSDKIDVRNIASPGHIARVDAAKYATMRLALLKILPDTPPGLTVAAAKEALLPHLDGGLFPGGEKAGWWLKCVQLDLEFKGAIARSKGAPVRLFRKADVA